MILTIRLLFNQFLFRRICRLGSIIKPVLCARISGNAKTRKTRSLYSIRQKPPKDLEMSVTIDHAPLPLNVDNRFNIKTPIKKIYIFSFDRKCDNFIFIFHLTVK